MMGVFVQLNEGSLHAHQPIGYVVQESGCWQWVGCTSRTGYGYLKPSGKKVIAHRWMYEREVGPIPIGLTIDHRCRNRGCVNPAHLEAVTQGVNVLRGDAPPSRNARKTHCVHGHEFTEANIYRPPSGVRLCRTCISTRSLNRSR